MFYFTCDHVWNWNKIISAAKRVLKLFQNYFNDTEHVWKYSWAAMSLWNNVGKFPHAEIKLFQMDVDDGWNNFNQGTSYIIWQSCNTNCVTDRNGNYKTISCKIYSDAWHFCWNLQLMLLLRILLNYRFFNRPSRRRLIICKLLKLACESGYLSICIDVRLVSVEMLQA